MQLKPEELRQSLDYTSLKTGYSSVVIEKDYYCSLILQEIFSHPEIQKCLVFKGGTLLSKAYLDFFRMSEDLDFSVMNEYCIQLVSSFQP